MRNIFFSTLLMSLFVSCVNFDEELKSLEVLSSKIDSASLNLTQIDTLKLNNNNQVVKGYLENINSNFKERFDKDQMFLLGSYKRISKQTSRFKRSYHLSALRADTLKKQRDNLQHDLQHKLIDNKELAKSYLQKELLAADELLSYSFQMIDWQKSTLQSFDSIHPKIKHIVDSLDQRKKRGRWY